MKRFLALVICLFTLVIAKAQENPRSSQYVFNSFLFNPAVAGIENYIDTKIGYRNQWTGLEGSPVTQYVSVHAPIGDNYVRSSINSFSGEGFNPMSRSYLNTYTAAEPHHGVGVYAMTDKAGRIKNTILSAAYAYHIGINSQVSLSVGATGGISSLNIDVDGILAENMNDPLFLAERNNFIRPNIGAGIWLYGAQFFAGLSAQKILGKSVIAHNGIQVSSSYQQPAFYGTAGIKMFIDEEIAAIPSVLISYWANSPVAVDANLKVAFRENFWAGVGLRNNDAYSFIAGLNFKGLVNLSYSYDVSNSALRNLNRGSHEIVLGLLLNNRYKVTCPMF